jgi:hypothetical protein
LGTAVLATVAYFDDGNDEDTVAVNITCSAGSINPTSAILGDGQGQSFVLSNIPEGVTVNCKVTQTAVAGYAANYLCAPMIEALPNVSIDGDVQCANPASQSLTSCSWDDVTVDNVGYCAITNAVKPQKYTVNKVWDVSKAGGGDYTDLTAAVTITCDNKDNSETSVYQKEIVGNGSVTVNVFPRYDGSSECSAEEDVVDSAVEVDNGCAVASTIKVGQGASCTITNTVFFEGIPTLNQYGMAIMALLMLGVGFVGFRRFV